MTTTCPHYVLSIGSFSVQADMTSRVWAFKTDEVVAKGDMWTEQESGKYDKTFYFAAFLRNPI